MLDRVLSRVLNAVGGLVQLLDRHVGRRLGRGVSAGNFSVRVCSVLILSEVPAQAPPVRGHRDVSAVRVFLVDRVGYSVPGKARLDHHERKRARGVCLALFVGPDVFAEDFLAELESVRPRLFVCEFLLFFGLSEESGESQRSKLTSKTINLAVGGFFRLIIF